MQFYNKTIQKLVNFDDVTKENITEYNPNWPEIFDYPYRIVIHGGSGSGKTNSSFNLINQQQILRRFIDMLKILIKQNINF